MAVLGMVEPIPVVETVGGSVPWYSNLISMRLSNSLFPGNPSSVRCLWDHPVSDEAGLKVLGWGECLPHLDPSHDNLGKSWKVRDFPQWRFSSSEPTKESFSNNKPKKEKCSGENCQPPSRLWCPAVSHCVSGTYSAPPVLQKYHHSVLTTHLASLTPHEQSSGRTSWVWSYLQHGSQMNERNVAFLFIGCFLLKGWE